MAITVISDLIGGQTKGKFPSTMGSALSINMYEESNGGTKYQKSVPGIRHLKELNATLNGCHGSYVASVGLTKNNSAPDMFFVSNNTVYRIDYAMNRSIIGYVAGDSYPTFAETGGERPFLLIADGSSVQAYNLKEGGLLQELGLPDRINEQGVKIKPSSVQVVNGSIIVNDRGTGYAYYSIPYPLSNEKRDMLDIVNGQVQYKADGITPKYVQKDSTSVVFLDDFGTQQYKNGESSSDSITALYAIGSNLIVFGPKSIEFWQRGSTEYETWTRTSYTFNRELGLDCEKSIASVNNSVFFVSNGMNAGRAIFAINGTEFTKISDTWIDDLLVQADTGHMIGYSYSRSNHAFYCLYIRFKDGSARTLCYDASTNKWAERSSRDYRTGKDKAWNCVYPVWFNNMTIFGHLNDSQLVYLDDEYHREDINKTETVPLIRRRQSPVVLSNYQNFILDEVGIELNTGTIKDYEANPKIQLEISEDGGNSFTNTLLEECGKTGQYFYRVRFLSLGMQRLCVLRITFSEDMDLTLTNASIRTTNLSYTM